jgi:hypothetical protein
MAAACAVALSAPARAGKAPEQRTALPALKTAVPWAAGAMLVLAPIVLARHLKRRASPKPDSSLAFLRQLSQREFERLLAQSFRAQGYDVEERPQADFRDGLRLVLRKPSQRILVRSLHRTSAQVGIEAVRGLHEVMSSEAASGGLIVTSEEVCPEARAWVAEKPIGLIEGRALLELINRGRSRRPGHVDVSPRREPYLGPLLAELLDCPLCGAPMVLRQTEAEAEVFGCSVPRCLGTRPV